jgi:hypothetical protein
LFGCFIFKLIFGVIILEERKRKEEKEGIDQDGIKI